MGFGASEIKIILTLVAEAKRDKSHDRNESLEEGYISKLKKEREREREVEMVVASG